MKIKRLLAVCLAAVIMVSALAIPASAATYSSVDTSYYWAQAVVGTWHDTARRYKETDSYIYMAPTNSPSAKTTVRTMCKSTITGGYRDEATFSPVTVYSGNKYIIDNYVYEHGVKETISLGTQKVVTMWLSVQPTDGRGVLSGNWSPDYVDYGEDITIV